MYTATKNVTATSTNTVIAILSVLDDVRSLEKEENYDGIIRASDERRAEAPAPSKSDIQSPVRNRCVICRPIESREGKRAR